MAFHQTFITDLSQGIGIRGHIRQDYQHVLLKLVGIIFCGSKRQTWGDDTFDGGVVGQVQEQGNTIQTSVLFKVLFEVPGSLHVDTHSSEDDREIVFVSVVYVLCWTLYQTCLSHDLRSNLVARGGLGEFVDTEDAKRCSLRYVGDRRPRK